MSRVPVRPAAPYRSTNSHSPGMGALLRPDGVTFRVWAPHAERVHVIGSFHEWQGDGIPLEREANGTWVCTTSDVSAGDGYKFRIWNGMESMDRIDPYAREVSNSIGHGLVSDPSYQWGAIPFEMPKWNEIVIYEMHIGTFKRETPDHVGRFAAAAKMLSYLKHLGVNAIEVMPTAEFSGDRSWGYNPAHIFAVESAYGGPRALKDFIKSAHDLGIAIILDVVYNHFGPSDLDLWRFDGWSENDKGGIYFYSDARSSTPWGETRPDYGRGEVRQFIHDNAMMWLNEYHVDGLRYDMTLYIRSVDGTHDIPEGWGLVQWINRDIRHEYKTAMLIAEDLQNNDYLTKPEELGGAGFTTQWDAGFVHPVRSVITAVHDQDRSMMAIRDAISHRYNLDAFERVIYTESHDEVANGKSRVPTEIAPGDDQNWFAQKRSMLGAALVFTSPGIPMVFQGQEFLEKGWFQDETELDWSNADRFRGSVRLYRDLIALRKSDLNITNGLKGQHVNVFHINDTVKVIAFHRWMEHGPGDDTIVVINFSIAELRDYRIGFPCPGKWRLRINSDWKGYSEEFADFEAADISTSQESYDGMPCVAGVSIAPYAFLVFSQERNETGT